jgi:xylan 1,4-beta-xylosidase
METHGLVQGYVFWTFSDIFEANYFPSVPFHGGFGLLNLYGIAKPAYRAFQLLHQLGDELLEIDGAHSTMNAWVVRKTTPQPSPLLTLRCLGIPFKLNL